MWKLKRPRLATSLSVVLRLRSMLDDESCDDRTIAGVIESDGVLLGTLCAVASSPLYGTRGVVTRASEALRILGAGTVRAVAFQVVLRQIVDGVTVRPARMVADQLWVHSLEVACLAKSLAPAGKGQSYYLAGLFHELPRFAFLSLSRDAEAYFNNEERIVESYAGIEPFSHDWCFAELGLDPAKFQLAAFADGCFAEGASVLIDAHSLSGTRHCLEALDDVKSPDENGLSRFERAMSEVDATILAFLGSSR